MTIEPNDQQNETPSEPAAKKTRRQAMMVIVPDDDRRPPEVTAKIRELEAQKLSLNRKDPEYKVIKKSLNKEIYRLSLIGLPRDLSWRNDKGRPAFLPPKSSMISLVVTPDQYAFVKAMGPKGNVSMGTRACIDFTMSARQLPKLPDGLDED